MVDINELAIADCLRHPRLGVITYQPSIIEPTSNAIPVRDINFKLHVVRADECEWASVEERNDYWSKNKGE